MLQENISTSEDEQPAISGRDSGTTKRNADEGSSTTTGTAVQYVVPADHASTVYFDREGRVPLLHPEPENIEQSPSDESPSTTDSETTENATKPDMHVAALFDLNNLKDMGRVNEIIQELRFPQASERLLMLGNPTCELLTSLSRLHNQNWSKIRQEILDMYTEFTKAGQETRSVERSGDHQLTAHVKLFERVVRVKIKERLGLSFDVNNEHTRAGHLAQAVIEWVDWRTTRSQCLKRPGFYRNMLSSFLYVASLGSGYGVYYLALSTYHDFNKFIISVLYNPSNAGKKYDWPELLSVLLADERIMSEFLGLVGNDVDKVMEATCKRRGMLYNIQTSEWLCCLRKKFPEMDEPFKSLLTKAICQSLASTNEYQQTAAFHIANPLILQDLFENDITQLFDLLEIKDKRGNTALHSNTNNHGLFSLILKLYQGQSVPRSRLISLLRITNNDKKTPTDLFTQLAWLYHQISYNKYPLYHKPVVIIIYRTTARFGAVTEAERIISALETLQLSPVVKQDLTESEIHMEITQAAARTRSALILFIMTHGSVGSITDKDDRSIKLSDIEMSMSQTTLPKLLITQCCQIDGANSNHTASNNSPLNAGTNHDPAVRATTSHPVFAPKHENMCVVMSCVQGQFSTRDFFIKIISEKLSHLNRDQGVATLVQGISDEMKQRGSDQIPLIQSTFSRELCLANCFHLWNSI